MQESAPLVGFVVAGLVVALGIYGFWQVKIRAGRNYLKDNPEQRNKSDDFGTFFLGGGRVGSLRTTNNNWGLCFAFANSIWYYAYLGYYHGIYILFLQVAWSLALVFIARHLCKYLAATGDGTVHGFIGQHYGVRASVLAATATIIGYTLNIGFELFYSSHLLLVSSDISAPRYELLLAICVSLFVGGYCAMGGYIASVETDLIQNSMGVVAVLMLLWLVRATLTNRSSLHQLLTASKAVHTPLSFIVGVVIFSFFFNLVDMATWQSIAANRYLSPEKLHDVRYGFYVAAGMQMIAPAILGTLFGAALRVTSAGIGDDAYFKEVLHPILGSMTPGRGLFVGILFLGLVSVTISSAGGYLLAAMQALAVDIFKRKEAKELRRAGLAEGDKLEIEQQIVLWVKQRIILVVVAMTTIFWALWFCLGKIDKSGLAFQFQFVMYGAATTLVPCVCYQLFWRKTGATAPTSSAGFWSILVGLCFVIVPFGLAEAPSLHLEPALDKLHLIPSDIVNLTPLFGLLAALIAFTLVRSREVSRAQ